MIKKLLLLISLILTIILVFYFTKQKEDTKVIQTPSIKEKAQTEKKSIEKKEEIKIPSKQKESKEKILEKRKEPKIDALDLTSKNLKIEVKEDEFIKELSSKKEYQKEIKVGYNQINEIPKEKVKNPKKDDNFSISGGVDVNKAEKSIEGFNFEIKKSF